MGYQKDVKYMNSFVSKFGMEIERWSGRKEGSPGFGPSGYYRITINGKSATEDMLLKDFKRWFYGFYFAKTGKTAKF